MLSRRIFLKTGLIIPTFSLANTLPIASSLTWPEKAFESKVFSQALQTLFNTDITTLSEAIILDAPSAESGKMVPITVTANLDKVSHIAIFALKNRFPLTAMYHITEPMLPSLAMQIRLAESSMVVAVVKADGILYRTEKMVEVMIGGCS